MNDKVNKLIIDNKNLVGWCFKRYINNYNHSHYDDIIQEGYMELIRVANKFDPEKGVRFSTYAIPCITGAMKRYMREKCDVVKIPREILDGDNSQTISNLRNYISLDSCIDEEDNSESLYSILGGENDDYEFIVDDLLESFLNTIESDRDRNIMEEYYYSCIYGEKVKQKDISRKYNISQSYFARIKNKYNEKFIKFIESR